MQTVPDDSLQKKKKWKGEWMLQGPGVSPGNSFNVVGQRVRQILVKLLLWRINKSTFHLEEKNTLWLFLPSTNMWVKLTVGIPASAPVHIGIH